LTIKERIIKKPGYKIVAGIAIIIAAIVYINKIDNSYINKFKNGELTLQCNINGTLKTIDPEKIQGFDDETGYFYFSNGYAKNCIVTKN